MGQDQADEDAGDDHPGADQEPVTGRLVAQIPVLLFQIFRFAGQIGHHEALARGVRIAQIGRRIAHLRGLPIIWYMLSS